ncbi:MAG: ATP-binding cassette domain-containing protein [Actinomycetota bacterium]
MALIDCSDVRVALPGGWTLFDGVTFRVPDGHHAALVGANGVGKTTLLRTIAATAGGVAGTGETQGTINVDGRLGYMRQFIAEPAGSPTIRGFLLSFAEPRLIEAADAVREAELRLASGDVGDAAQLAYADALAAWEEAGGYDAEVQWDVCSVAAMGETLADVGERLVATLSGGEQKRLALELLFRSPFEVLLLDEPDNFLDIDGKRWLERTIRGSDKTILFVSHDRTLLAATTTRVITLEGHGAWVHPDNYATFAEAREARLERIDEEHRRYNEEHKRLVAAMKEMKRKAAYNDGWATKARSMEKRIERYEVQKAPREKAAEQNVQMAIAGGRTGKMALRLTSFGMPGLILPFDAEIWFGERVGVVGPNGTGKTHFLRLLAGEDIAHEGEWRLGARVEPGLFTQLHHRPDLSDSPILEILRSSGMGMSEAMSTLKRYELQNAARNPFGLLSGGQQARFQLLLMEVQSPTMLLLDEPTDNLDLHSAEALEDALSRYEGTVIAVTHDRWFMQGMDRFLSFDEDGSIRQLLEPPYEEARVAG